MEKEGQVIETEHERPTLNFSVGGCSVTATFQPQGQGADLDYVLDLLLESHIKQQMEHGTE